jgi:hypothetical protein
MIRKATISAAAPVIPITVPRDASEVQLESAGVGRRQGGVVAHAEREAHGKQRNQPAHRPGRDCRDRPRQSADRQRAPRAEAARKPATDQLKRGVGIVEGRKGNPKRAERLAYT